MSIKLNISGRVFLAQKEVLCKSQFFSNMFEDCEEVSDEIMIYRSPMLFEHIYAYLLDDKYPYPKKYRSELDYYLIGKPNECEMLLHDLRAGCRESKSFSSPHCSKRADQCESNRDR